MDQFLKISGIILWVLIVLYATLRMIYGKNWLIKVGANTFLGSGLISASKKLIGEVRKKNIQEDTVAEVGAHVIWRLTRIGVFAIIIALIPFILLFLQNQLIQQQNILINRQAFQDSLQTQLLIKQNIKLDTQNNLFQNQNQLFTQQNKKVIEQTDLLGDQTNLFKEQNTLFRNQNRSVDTQLVLMETQNDLLIDQNLRIDTQNYRLNLQNNLIEADRRSSLVFLMSNVLDRLDQEIKTQGESINPHNGYQISAPLLGRIIALSRAFRPYRVLEGDTLSSEAISPERGQLFISLMENNWDSLTQKEIASNCDFSNAVIGRINLNGSYLPNIKLKEANLYKAEFYLANLYKANLYGANLEEVNFQRANLEGAILQKANLYKAELQLAKLQWAILEGVNFVEANLYKANLEGANLEGASLHRAILPEINLYGAYIREAYLEDADLSMANLEMAYLEGTNLQRANLEGANLYGANLKKTILVGANLVGTNLKRAILEGANLEEAYLRRAQNITKQQLATVKSLYNCIGLPPKIKRELKKEKPCLFKKGGCN